MRRATFERVVGILCLQSGVKIVANVALPTTTDSATEMVLTVTRKPITVGVAADYLQPGVRGLAHCQQQRPDAAGRAGYGEHAAAERAAG